MAIKTYNDQNFVAIANAIRSKSKNPTTYKPSEMAAAISAIESGFELLPQDTVSGAIANFPDGSDGYPVVELIANIEPKQSGSGDPAPDNVRPISGSTEVKVSKQGKNLADGNMTQDGANRVIIINGLYLKPGDYNISLSTSGTIANFYMKTHSSGSWSNVGGDNKTSVTFTISSADYYDISYYVSTGVNASDISNLQLEVGSAKTDYVHYSAPEVKTIDLGRTVYSGTLNVTTGLLTIDYKYMSISEVQQEYAYAGTGYYGGRLTLSDMKYNSRSNGYCETLKPISSPSGQTLNCVCFGAGNSDIFIVMSQDLVGSTLESLNNYLSSNPVNVLYPLDTPETYQLTPEQVKTLLGVNNISADTGNVSVTYRANIDLYIAKKIAEGA